MIAIDIQLILCIVTQIVSGEHLVKFVSKTDALITIFHSEVVHFKIDLVHFVDFVLAFKAADPYFY